MSVPLHPEDFSFVPDQPVTGPSPLDPKSQRADPAHSPHSTEGETEVEVEEYGVGDDAFTSTSADWKANLRKDFESWLDTLDDIPTELSEAQDPDDNPELIDVFGNLASLALENRKSNRRTSEAFAQWNAVLTGFQDDLKRLRERERAQLENQPPPDTIPAPLAAFLVDFHDRLTRLAQAQAQMPVARLGFFGDDTVWKTAWQNQRSALDITLSHLQTFLKEQGFQRIHALGQPLDPARMAVIETRLAPDKTPHTVIEETAPGWILGSRVLRPAQVIVAIPAPSSHR